MGWSPRRLRQCTQRRRHQPRLLHSAHGRVRYARRHARTASLLPGFIGTDGTVWTFAFENTTSLWATEVVDSHATGTVRNYAQQSGTWVGGGLVTLDPSNPVYSVFGRVENSAATGFANRYIIYGTTESALLRFDTVSAVVTTVATPGDAWQHFRGVAQPPTYAC